MPEDEANHNNDKSNKNNIGIDSLLKLERKKKTKQYTI